MTFSKHLHCERSICKTLDTFLMTDDIWKSLDHYFNPIHVSGVLNLTCLANRSLLCGTMWRHEEDPGTFAPSN